MILIPSGFDFVGEATNFISPKILALSEFPVIGEKLGLGGTLSLFVVDNIT